MGYSNKIKRDLLKYGMALFFLFSICQNNLLAKTETCKVIFKSGDEVISDSYMPSEQIIELGAKVNNPGRLTSPSRYFLGWYKNDGAKFDFDTPITEDLILTARFARPIQRNNQDYVHVEGKLQYYLYNIGIAENPYIVAQVIGYDKNDLPAQWNLEIPEKISCDISGSVEEYKVTEVNSAFRECSNLTSIKLPKSIEYISHAFVRCNNLSNVEIADGNNKCIVVNNVLYEITSSDTLALIFFPMAHKDNMGVTTTKFEIPEKVICTIDGVLTEFNVTTISTGAFGDCSSLESVTIPEGVTRIGEGAFDGCSSLTSITIPESVTSIGYTAFYGCNKMSSIVIADGNGKYILMDDVLYEVTDKLAKEVSLVWFPEWRRIGEKATKEFAIPKMITYKGITYNVTSIGGCAFYNCINLTTIMIPEGVTSIGNWAFEGCKSLISLTLPNSVKKIELSAFFDCSSLTSVKLSEGLEDMGGSVFYGCDNLSTITIENNNKYIVVDNVLYKVTDEENMEMSLLLFLASQQTNGEVIKEFAIPEIISHNNINYKVTGIGEYAFSDDDSLINIEIPNSVMTIGLGAFGECTNLTNIVIPGSVKNIGKNAFYGCTGLTDVTIMEGAEKINYCAFYGCSNLAHVTIPESMISVDEGAFYGCNKLELVVVCGKIDFVAQTFGYNDDVYWVEYPYHKVEFVGGLNSDKTLMTQLVFRTFEKEGETYNKPGVAIDPAEYGIEVLDNGCWSINGEEKFDFKGTQIQDDITLRAIGYAGYVVKFDQAGRNEDARQVAAKGIKVETQTSGTTEISQTIVTIEGTGFKQNANPRLQKSLLINKSDLSKYGPTIKITYYYNNEKTKKYKKLGEVVTVSADTDLVINNIYDGLRIVVESGL